MSRIIRHIKNLRRCQSGLAAVEFALALPIFVALLMGGAEVARYILVHQKVEKLAFSVADVTSQFEILGSGDIGVIMDASAEIMDPYDQFDSNGRIVLSSVFKDPDENNQHLQWQCEGGGTASATSHVAVPDSSAAAVLPGSMVLDDGDDVIVAEIFYSYTPMLDWFNFGAGSNIYKTAMFRPRLGALTAVPGC